MSIRRAWQQFEVALTGPFLTGHPLQVRMSEYTRFQRELGEDLKGDPSGGWDYESIKWRGVESYGSGGGYSSLVPLVLMRREGPALMSRLEEAQRGRPDVEQEWLHDALEGWTWRLRKLRVELYDLGVGVIAGVYHVAAPVSLSVKATRRNVESIGHLLGDPNLDVRSPVAAAYEIVARETVSVLASVVARRVPNVRQEPWLTPLLNALPATVEPTSARQHDGEWGRLLWLHPVFVLAGSPSGGWRQRRKLARPFVPTFSTTIKYWHGTFVPGIDSSVIVTGGSDAFVPQEVPMRLTELQWAYYAVFMEMDRGLLALLDNDKWQTPESLATLEADTERMFAIYTRIQEARARLDSALTDLAGGQLSIWNAIADVQKFDHLVAAVEGKVETLQRIAERRVQEAAAARERRTSNILSGLTALTVVTVAIALMANFIGTPADSIGHIDVRIITIIAAFLIALLLYREAQREIALKRERVARLEAHSRHSQLLHRLSHITNPRASRNKL
jgi:hypothetical protein